MSTSGTEPGGEQHLSRSCPHGDREQGSVGGLVSHPDSGAPVPRSPTHQQPSSHPGCQPRPGQEESSRRNLHCLEKCILASVSGAHNPPTFLIQWDFFQQEGGPSD